MLTQGNVDCKEDIEGEESTLYKENNLSSEKLRAIRCSRVNLVCRRQDKKRKEKAVFVRFPF